MENKATFTWDMQDILFVRSIRIWSFSGPYFPALGPNTEIYIINLSIQSECIKVRTGKIPNSDTFYSVMMSKITQILCRLWKHLSTLQCLKIFKIVIFCEEISTSFKEMNAVSLWKVFTSEISLYSKARQVFVNKHEVLVFLMTICSLSCFV